MSNKTIIRFVVAFSVLAVLLIFLGVNAVHRSSASSSNQENVMDPSKYTMPDYIERHLPAVSNPVRNTSPDWIERHPPIVARSVNYAGAEVIIANAKIAPVFDATGAIISDPTGTLLNASQPGASVVPVTGANRKIAPVFDATGAVVSDPTGTILSAVNP